MGGLGGIVFLQSSSRLVIEDDNDDYAVILGELILAVTKADVEERAVRWDVSADGYLQKSRLYLSGHHRESTYSSYEIRYENMRVWCM